MNSGEGAYHLRVDKLGKFVDRQKIGKRIPSLLWSNIQWKPKVLLETLSRAFTRPTVTHKKDIKIKLSTFTIVYHLTQHFQPSRLHFVRLTIGLDSVFHVNLYSLGYISMPNWAHHSQKITECDGLLWTRFQRPMRKFQYQNTVWLSTNYRTIANRLEGLQITSSTACNKRTLLINKNYASTKIMRKKDQF